MDRSRKKLYVSFQSVLKVNNIDPYKISEAEKQAQMDEMWKKHEQKDQLYEENDQFVLEDELDIDFEDY